MKKLLKYLKPYRKECVIAPAFKMLEALFELFVPEQSGKYDLVHDVPPRT